MATTDKKPYLWLRETPWSQEAGGEKLISAAGTTYMRLTGNKGDDGVPGRDGKDGKAVLVINNSLTEATTVELPADATRYTLAGKDGNMRATVMTLNGRDLVLGEGDALPDLSGEAQPAGTVEVAPGSCVFFVL